MINTIIHQKSDEFLPGMAPAAMDLIIYDPWFGVSEEEFSFHIEEFLRVLSPTGSLYFFIDWKNIFRLYPFCRIGDGFHLQNIITWCRTSPGNTIRNFKSNREEIMFLTRHPKNYTFNKPKRRLTGKDVLPYKEKDGRPRGWYFDETLQTRVRWSETGSVWNFSDACYDETLFYDTRPFWSSKEKTSHTCQKPETLIERLVLTSTNAGDMILDPTSGSGVTSVVAKRHKRSSIAVEENPRFIEESRRRLEKTQPLEPQPTIVSTTLF